MLKLQFYVFMIGLLLPASAWSSSCVFPDDGSDVMIHTDCPRLVWSVSGGLLQIVDHGEYVWVDAAGRVVYERTLSEVPEPYRAMYKQGHRTPSGELTFAAPDAVPMLAETADSSPYTAQVLESRRTWRITAATWYAELYASMRALIHQTVRPYPAANNPLLTAHPGAIVLVATDPETMRDARGRALHARAMLLEELPRLARQSGVPPAWLQAP